MKVDGDEDLRYEVSSSVSFDQREMFERCVLSIYSPHVHLVFAVLIDSFLFI